MTDKRTKYIADYHRRLYHFHKKLIREYAALLGCEDCGISGDWRVLEWDHLPEYKKVGNISSLLTGSWARLERELDKCEVVCANCHSIRTHERGQYIT